MREFSSFLFIFPVFAQPGAFYGPKRRISKSDRTSFDEEFPFAKLHENSFPGASSFSDSIIVDPTVSPTSTVSDSADTTSSSQNVDKELDRDLDEEIKLEFPHKNGFENPMPFFGEIIKKMTSRFLSNDDNFIPVIKFSTGNFDENNLDPFFVSAMGTSDDWLQNRIGENELLAAKIQKEQKIKEEKENFMKMKLLASHREKKITRCIIFIAALLGFCLGAFFVLVRVYIYRRNHPKVGVISACKSDAEKQPLILA